MITWLTNTSHATKLHQQVRICKGSFWKSINEMWNKVAINNLWPCYKYISFFFLFGASNRIWFQQNYSASQSRLSAGLCSISRNQQQSHWLIRKNYTTIYWWPLYHIVSLLCFFFQFSLLFFWWFNSRKRQSYSQKWTCSKFDISSWCFESIYCKKVH